MSKLKVWPLLIGLVLILTLVLAGCQPTDTPQPEVTQVPPEPTATEPPEEVAWSDPLELASDYEGELVLWDWGFEPRNKWMEKYIAEWEQQHPGVTVTYEVLPESDVGSKLSTAVVAGTGPDFSVVNQEWRIEFQRNGLLEPLPAEFFPEGWRKLLFSTPYLRDESGDIYVTSVGAMGAELYWDKSIFSEAGYTEDDVPETWEELVTLAKELTTWNDDGSLDRAGFGVNGLPAWLWFDLVVQKGGHFYDEGVNQTLWAEEAGLEAAQFIGDLFLVDKVTSPQVPWWGELYCNGKAAMGYGYAWMPGWVASNCPEKADDLGIAPLPTFDNAPAQGLQLQEDFIAVFADTEPEKQALIWDFLHFILLEDDERIIELALDFGVPPDRMDLGDDPRVLAEDLLRVGAEVAPYSVRPGPLPMFGDHMMFLTTAFEEILLQETAPADALSSAVEQADMDLGASGKTYTSTEWAYTPPNQ